MHLSFLGPRERGMESLTIPTLNTKEFQGEETVNSPLILRK
jgi:hypothetical protein